MPSELSHAPRWAAVLAMAAVLGGCGQTTGNDARTRFIERADALCVANGDRLRSVTPPGTPDQIPAYLDQAIPSNEQLVRQLRELTPPPQDRATVATILAGFDAVLARARAYRDAARTGDDTATHAAYEEYSAALSSASDAARAYGLRDCAAQGTPTGSQASPPGSAPSPTGGPATPPGPASQ